MMIMMMMMIIMMMMMMMQVSLGVGAYRTDEGKPWILPCVKKAESILARQVEEEKINHEYLPVLGLDGFTKAATKMLLGEDSPALAENRAFGIQVICDHKPI